MGTLIDRTVFIDLERAYTRGGTATLDKIANHLAEQIGFDEDVVMATSRDTDQAVAVLSRSVLDLVRLKALYAFGVHHDGVVSAETSRGSCRSSVMSGQSGPVHR